MVGFQDVFAECCLDKCKWMDEKNDQAKRSFTNLIHYPHCVDENGEV